MVYELDFKQAVDSFTQARDNTSHACMRFSMNQIDEFRVAISSTKNINEEMGGATVTLSTVFLSGIYPPYGVKCDVECCDMM